MWPSMAMLDIEGHPAYILLMEEQREVGRYDGRVQLEVEARDGRVQWKCSNVQWKSAMEVEVCDGRMQWKWTVQ